MSPENKVTLICCYMSVGLTLILSRRHIFPLNTPPEVVEVTQQGKLVLFSRAFVLRPPPFSSRALSILPALQQLFFFFFKPPLLVVYKVKPQLSGVIFFEKMSPSKYFVPRTQRNQQQTFSVSSLCKGPE